MKRLQKSERCSYKDNPRIILNKLFSSETMSEINLKGYYREIIITEQKYERLQKFGRSSYKDNSRSTSNKLFSSEMISEVNLKCIYKEIIITEQKYETFTKVRNMQLQK